MENRQPTRWGRVREFGTRVRLLDSSNRVVVGRTQAGWAGRVDTPKSNSGTLKVDTLKPGSVNVCSTY